MRASLRLKLFVVLLLVAAVVAAATYAIMQWSFERGFIALVEARQRAHVEQVVAGLAAEYAQAGGWMRLRGDRRRWMGILFSGRPGAEGHMPRWARRPGTGASNRWPPDGRHGEDPLDRQGRLPLELRMMLLDADRSVLFGRAEALDRLALEPIDVEGRTVGYLGVLPGPALNEIADIRFVEEQKRTFFAIAALVVLLAAALALPLAGALTRRLRGIAAATRDLAAGRYDTRVPVGSSDELGGLATDVNDLAAALERTETARRAWIADVSHELRTPLAVLRGELEALQDGVRPLDAAAVDSLHADALRLGRLVDDLYDLARADLGALSYRKVELDPLAVLADDLAALGPDFAVRGIDTEMAAGPGGAVRVHADPDRLSQLFRNLLTNTLRYTDPGGRLAIRAAREGSRLAIELHDTAPGVPAPDLPRLFDRFHRVEASRSREHGGAGLGLAIARRIVEAHDGTIEARDSPLGGLAIRIELPVSP